MKNMYFKSVIVFFIIVSGFSCNTVTGPTDRTVEIRTITTYQGEWTGTTSEGNAISFTVTGNTITRFEINILQSVPGKPAEKATYSLNKTVVIASSDFTVEVSLNPVPEQSISYGLPVSGHFNSTTAAAGISVPSAGSGVTWMADKK